MTLKEFAEKNGIGYNLAKQWKLRGKIVTEGDGYKLVTPPKRGRLQQPDATKPVTLYVRSSSGVTPERVAELRQEFEQQKKASDSWPYQPLPLVSDCPVCHGARWACEHTPIEDLTQIELLTRDNRILSQAVDSLRDLTTEHGSTLSNLRREIAELRSNLTEAVKATTDIGNVVLALQTEVAYLRSRVADQQQPAATHTVSRSAAIDPPGPQWGA